MLVEVKDLQIGDEIIISANSQFRYLRVLRAPRIGKKMHWRKNTPMYTSVKCSTRMEKETYTWTTNNGKAVTRFYDVYKFTDEDHNKELNVDLNERGIFLIKKAKI